MISIDKWTIITIIIIIPPLVLFHDILNLFDDDKNIVFFGWTRKLFKITVFIILLPFKIIYFIYNLYNNVFDRISDFKIKSIGNYCMQCSNYLRNLLKTSKSLLIFVVLLVSISSTIYLVENYYFYYYAKEKFLQNELHETNQNIKYIIAENSNNFDITRKLERYIKNKKYEVSIVIKDRENLIQKIKNNYILDLSRTITSNYDELKFDDYEYSISMRSDVRPPILQHLARAWSFSVVDYFNNQDSYKKNQLIMRSIPLIASIIITLIILNFFYMYARARENRKEAEYKFLVKKEEERLVERIRAAENEQSNSLRQISSKYESERLYLHKEIEKLNLELYNKSKNSSDIDKNNVEIAKYKIIVNEYELYKQNSNSEIEKLKNILNVKDKVVNDLNSKLLEAKCNNNNDELNELRKIVESSKSSSLNRFELEVSSYIDSQILNKKNNFIKYLDHDISLNYSEPQTVDLILSCKHCIYVFENKGYFDSIIYCDGDYLNDKWKYKSTNGNSGYIACSHGNNPYKQSKSYSNNILSKINNANIGRKPPIISIAIFPDNSKIDGIGVSVGIGIYQINQFAFVVNKSKIQSLIEIQETKFSKNMFNIEAYKIAELIL